MTTLTAGWYMDSGDPLQPERAEGVRILLDRLVERDAPPQERLVEMSDERRGQRDGEVAVAAQERLHDHRLVPEHGPRPAEDPERRWIRHVVRERHVVDVNRHAGAQAGERLE